MNDYTIEEERFVKATCKRCKKVLKQSFTLEATILAQVKFVRLMMEHDKECDRRRRRRRRPSPKERW